MQKSFPYTVMNLLYNGHATKELSVGHLNRNQQHLVHSDKKYKDLILIVLCRLIYDIITLLHIITTSTNGGIPYY